MSEKIEGEHINHIIEVIDGLLNQQLEQIDLAYQESGELFPDGQVADRSLRISMGVLIEEAGCDKKTFRITTNFSRGSIKKKAEGVLDDAQLVLPGM
jgi:hypothetical protein